MFSSQKEAGVALQVHAKCSLQDNIIDMISQTCTVSCFKLFYRIKIVKASYHPISGRNTSTSKI